MNLTLLLSSVSTVQQRAVGVKTEVCLGLHQGSQVVSSKFYLQYMLLYEPKKRTFLPLCQKDRIVSTQQETSTCPYFKWEKIFWKIMFSFEGIRLTTEA